jgi:hypothetical protein
VADELDPVSLELGEKAGVEGAAAKFEREVVLSALPARTQWLKKKWTFSSPFKIGVWLLL